MYQMSLFLQLSLVPTMGTASKLRLTPEITLMPAMHLTAGAMTLIVAMHLMAAVTLAVTVRMFPL
jgi:hypothetical protein